MARPRLDPSGYESLVINPDFCFENFVEGPGNRLALAAARAVADKPGKAYNPLFLHGGVGLGKTHLLQAICVRILENNPGARLFYTSCEGFVTRFMECVASGGMIDFRHTFRDVDVLVIDDIHFLATRERTQEEFFHTFNTLYHSSKQIILSSDAAPEEIPQLENRLVSRFMWGLVVTVDPPDYETRIAILKSKARIRGLSLADDVASFVARRVDTNIRELEGAIVKLQIQSTVENRPIDLDLTRAALGEARATGAEPSLQAITGVVTDFYRVRLPDLQSKSRHRSVTLPRQVAMFLARRLTRHSLEEIGGYFGGRDHTTVMHAIRTVDDRKGLDPDFDAVLRALEEKIRQGRSA
jgi:chromosomal replication initiator protein